MAGGRGVSGLALPKVCPDSEKPLLFVSSFPCISMLFFSKQKEEKDFRSCYYYEVTEICTITGLLLNSGLMSLL